MLEMAEENKDDSSTTSANEPESQLSLLFKSDLHEPSWLEEAREKLEGIRNFQVLVDLFFQLRDSLYIAHNEAVVSGEHFSNVEVDIHKMSLEAARLCSDSVMVLGKFENGCGEAISNIQTGYSQLLKGQDKLAVIAFQQLSKTASEMEEASRERSKCFNSLIHDAENVLGKVLTLKSIQDGLIEEMDKDMKKLSVRKSQEDDKIIEAILMEKKAIEQQHTLEAKDNAMTVGTLFEGFVHSIKQISCSFPPNFAIEFHRKDNAPHSDMIRNTYATPLEYDEASQKKQRAKEEGMSLDTRAAELKSGRDKSDYAITALRDAAGYLKQLSAFMLRFAQFWKQIKIYCDRIFKYSDQEVQRVNVVLQIPTADRLQLLQSKEVEKTMFQLLLYWQTMQKICAESKIQLRKIETRLFEDVKENPTQDEAEGNLLRATNCIKTLD